MLHITKEHIEEMKAQMPEMPRERRNRLKSEWGLSDLQMRDILNADALDLIEETVKAGAKLVPASGGWASFPAKPTPRVCPSKSCRSPRPMWPRSRSSSPPASSTTSSPSKTVEGVLNGEGTPDEVVEEAQLQIVEDDGAIEAAVDAAFEANPDVVEKLKSGNMKPMGVIIGAVMKATRGQADAQGRHQGRHGQDQGLIRFTGSRWWELSNGVRLRVVAMYG